jgi:hypothetical protein
MVEGRTAGSSSEEDGPAPPFAFKKLLRPWPFQSKPGKAVGRSPCSIGHHSRGVRRRGEQVHAYDGDLQCQEDACVPS